MALPFFPFARSPAMYGGGAAPSGDVILLETGDALLLETTDPLDKDTGIPAQSSASALDGVEWTVIVQGGTTVKVATARLLEYLNG